MIIVPNNHHLVKNVTKDEYDVYIGRWTKRIQHQSIWHNPFKDGTREENIERFVEYLASNEYLLSKIYELKGKRLGCWCDPLLCHGTVLAEIANE
jgi:hypothetical protein